MGGGAHTCTVPTCQNSAVLLAYALSKASLLAGTVGCGSRLMVHRMKRMWDTSRGRGSLGAGTQRCSSGVSDFGLLLQVVPKGLLVHAEAQLSSSAMPQLPVRPPRPKLHAVLLLGKALRKPISTCDAEHSQPSALYPTPQYPAVNVQHARNTHCVAFSHEHEHNRTHLSSSALKLWRHVCAPSAAACPPCSVYSLE